VGDSGDWLMRQGLCGQVAFLKCQFGRTLEGHSMHELPMALDRAAGQPLSEQLASQLRQAAAEGQLRVGERMPSTRALATTLGVSRTVTAAAFDQLYAEGWIEARRGSGTYVMAVPAAVGNAVPSPQAANSGSDDCGRSASRRTTWRDLRPGSPWAAGIRPDMWRRAWRAAADAGPDGRHVRGGLAEFRRAVAEHVVRHRGLLVDPAAVIATGGTTAAVAELAMAVLGRGDAVAVEEPGYPRAVETFRAAGLRVLPARVDHDGLVVDRIPAGARAVYCTPAHQFPLGGRLSAARRVDLVAWAREHDAWLIEDDYDGELRYDVTPLPLLAGLGPDVVVHLGTTSKILSPTLGVGWLVGPADVVDAVLAHREATSTSPSLAGQRLLTAFLLSGDLSRHLRRVRKELTARRGDVVDALTAAGSAVLGDRAGAHVVVPLADVGVERAAVAAGREVGLLLEGLERCFTGAPDRAGLTLGYAALSSRRELDAALRVLAGLI
jgi:GntR family transcriptional regulator/MocR family aminotransferase